MRHLILIPFLFLACSNSSIQKIINVTHFDSGFSLYQDTIFVDTEDQMSHALKYQDKLYVIFNKDYESRSLYIFSDGQIENIIELPNKSNVVYLDFFVKNDTVFLKPYMNNHYYYFDIQNSIWKETDCVDDLIFEDEKYYVFSLDFGEWGGKTWFKDKKTGMEYLTEVTTPLINKIDTNYYLTTFYEILEIEDPQKLNECNLDVTYENIEASGKWGLWYGKPVGYNVVYKDTTSFYFSDNFFYIYKPRIISSFVWQNDLFHIYEADTVVYIAKIEDNSIKPVQKIGEEIFFYNFHYSYRCRNLGGNNELLKFRTKDEQLYGLMEVVDNKIFIHYLLCL